MYVCIYIYNLFIHIYIIYIIIIICIYICVCVCIYILYIYICWYSNRSFWYVLISSLRPFLSFSGPTLVGVRFLSK